MDTDMGENLDFFARENRLQSFRTLLPTSIFDLGSSSGPHLEATSHTDIGEICGCGVQILTQQSASKWDSEELDNRRYYWGVGF